MQSASAGDSVRSQSLQPIEQVIFRPIIIIITIIIIINDSMTSVLNTNASLQYSHDLFESLIVKKRIK
ncbi:hypothetical protein T265_14898, partial [Opisthorchis viverrini]